MPFGSWRCVRWLGFLLALGLVNGFARESRVLERGAHHNRVVQVVVDHEPGTGRPVARTNTWVQLEDGLNYWDAADGIWRESREEIRIAGRGAVALEGSTRAIFSSNANDPEGAVDLELGPRHRLRSSVLALRYFDAATGGVALLGMVRDVRGELLPPNQVIYRDVFDEVHADLVYTYRRRGVEADVVLREVLPDPADFGLIPETTRLEVVTEFFDPPRPVKRERLLAAVEDERLRGIVAEPDWVDEELDFGRTRIGEGRAFAWSAREAAERRPSDFPLVGKRWVVTEDGRTLLVESVEYVGLYEDLLALPGDAARKVRLEERSAAWAGLGAGEIRDGALRERATELAAAAAARGMGPGWAGVDPALASLRRPVSVAAGIDGGIRLAAVDATSRPGLVLDWNSLTTGASNFTFAATNTYYVTGACTFTGTTTFEGGAVIKFPPASGIFRGIEVAGPLVCRGGAYRPVIFTADSDNTVGEGIVSGVPDPMIDYGSRYLRVTHYGAPVVVEHMRFRHANEALVLQANNIVHRVRHVQFVGCRVPVTSLAGTTIRMHNVLIHGGKPTGFAFSGPTTFQGEHLTVHQVASLRNGGVLSLTNSVVAAVGVVQGYSGAGNWQAAGSAGLFEAAGAGFHYLPAVSPLRNAGVAGVDPLLRADLAEMTTDAPRVLGGHVQGIETNLVRRARRDTDALDIGYHYAPLDHAVGGRLVAQGTLRLTDGAALGVYGASGLVLGLGGRFESLGSALSMNRVVYFSLVQEQTASAWASPSGDIGLLELGGGGAGAVPEVRWEFTEAWMPAGIGSRRQWVRPTSAGAVVLRMAHSRVRGLSLTLTGFQAGGGLWLTNNLFEDVDLDISQSGVGGYFPVGLVAYNNLFRGGVVRLASSRGDSPWLMRDNLFDVQGLVWSGVSGTFSHNGYRAGLPAVGFSNRTGLVMDYAGGPLGEYAYPTLGEANGLASLLDRGSRTASAAGLYPYTVRSDGLAERATLVDIGYHYAAPAEEGTGLVGYWRLDESGGTVANDSSGNGLHGTLVNGPVWTAAHVGNGVALDGINDQVRVPDAPALRLTEGFTLAFWVRKHAEIADFALYLGKGGPNTRNFAVWDLAGPAGNLMLQFQSPSGDYRTLVSRQSLSVDRWYHIACTWDGSTGRIFIDGLLDSTGSMAGPAATSADPLVMGYAGYHGRFAGVLDEVKVFNRALELAEIAGLMSSESPGPDPKPRLGYWRLNETAGGTATDASGRGHHGQLSPGPQWTAGRFGNGLRFDGVDDMVTVPDAPGLRPTSAFTLAFWVNKTSEPADFSRILGKGGVLTRNFGVWDVAGPSGLIMLQFQTAGGEYRTLTSARQLVSGQWYHVACTWDGGTGRIYINGVLDRAGSMAGPPATSAEPVTLGYAGYHTYFPGRLDEVLISGRAFSAGEVAVLASGGVASSGLPGVVAAWPLDASGGLEATDVSGNGLHGTLSIGRRWVGGLVGNAVHFDGLNDSLTIPDHSDFRLTSAFTVAFWVRKASENQDFVRYIGKGGPLTRNFGVWDLPGADGRVMLQFQDSNGSYRSFTGAYSIPVGVWHHVACTWDGGVGRIYINGQLDGTAAMPGPPATSGDPITLGHAGYHGRFHGELDQVELHGRALGPAEILGLLRMTPADADRDGFGDASEDRNGNGIRDAGETSFVDADSDYDGRSDAEERMDGTDPLDPRSVKPVRLALWSFDQLADPWRADTGALPLERTGVGHVEVAPFVYGVELAAPGAVLRYRDVEADGRANINARQGAIRVYYAPNWASQSSDCPPGTAGTGPGELVELVSVGDFSIAIDARGTNLMLRSPHSSGGYVTNAQVPFRACTIDFAPDFPMDILVSYATNASAVFVNGELKGRGSGIQAAPNRGSRAHGLFIGSGSARNNPARGVIDALLTYNVPLFLSTNAAAMTLSITQSLPTVVLRWSAVSNAYYLIERRIPPATAWQRLASVTPPVHTDATIAPGVEYEYRLQPDAVVPEEFQASTDPAPLTMTAGLRLPPVEAPGHVALIVDRTLTNNAAYASAVGVLTRDLSAEGWVVARFDGPRHDDQIWANNPGRIAQVRNWIGAYQNAFPNQLKAVFLFGHLPIPFSGMLSPDGHSFRPLPADSYYGDMDGVWTDSMNWPLQLGVAAPNVPGDGIFDQELVPPNADGRAAVELAVGRVDFANMPVFAAGSPSRGEVDLLVQYVEKTRRYRRAEIVLPERVVYGGYFSSNAVSEASDRLGQHLERLGRRLGAAVSGTDPAGVVKGDFMAAGLPAVWGVLGGFAGGYDSLHSRGEVWPYHGIGIRRTSDLVLEAMEPPVAFSVVEGSWMSEWHAPNHLGRGLLATRNYGYSWSYANATRVEWQYPAMALGRTLGEGWVKTQNDAWMWPLVSLTFRAPYAVGTRVYTGSLSQGGYVFNPLLGDPTLRQAPSAPPGALTGQLAAGQMQLSWGASAVPGAGYHVYRATGGVGGEWVRLNSVPVTGTAFSDTAPSGGLTAYMVRALRLREVATGSVTNLSAGSIWP